MKCKLNVFSAIMFAWASGASAEGGNSVHAGVCALLVVINLWIAGFFGDSK